MDKLFDKIVPYMNIDTKLTLGIPPGRVELVDIDFPQYDEDGFELSDGVIIMIRSIWYPADFTFEKWTREVIDDETCRWTINITRTIIMRDGQVITESWNDTEMSPEWWTPVDDIETSDSED